MLGWLVASAVIAGAIFWSFDPDYKPTCPESMTESFNEWVKKRALR